MTLDCDDFPLPPNSASARFSPCRTYRYALERVWDPSLKPVCFLMLNPSTANAFVLDPTIRRCIGFAKAWGHGGVRVVNLFAYRSTSPDAMKDAFDPVADPLTEMPFHKNENDYWIVNQSDTLRLIAAWGVHGRFMQRDAEVMELLGRDRIVECLGTTKDGHPKHPLYVPAITKPERFYMPAARAGAA